MATKWISPTWRMPDEQNQSKFENYGLSLNGQDESINCGNIPALISSSNFTISGWFTQTTLNQTRILLGTRGGNTDTVGIYTYTDGFMYIDVKNGSASYGKFDYSTVISADTWFHLAMVFDGSGSANADKLKLYINNSEVTLTYNSTIPASTSSTALDFKLGIVEGLNDEWLGKMAQVAVFDYTLSTNQISYLYNSGTPVNPMAISGNAPIAYYPLGGSSTGSSSTLTIPNESVPSATVFDFIDGNDTFIDCGANENILDFSGNNYTVSAWVNWDGTGDSNQMIASVKSGGSNVDFVLSIQQSTGKIIYWNGSTQVFSNSAIPTGVWCMVTVIVKAGQKDFFIDGVADGTPSQTRVASATAATKFLIGKSNYASEFFNGKVSNLQIWNSPLLQSEITTLYNNGVPLLTGTQPQAANLKAWYPMNVGNANWAADTASDWQIADAVSAYPQSFNFSGTDDAINISNNSVFNLGTSFTISGWFNVASYINNNMGYISFDSSSPRGWFLFHQNTNLALYDGTAVRTLKASFTPTNTWNSYIITYNGTDLIFYLNGVPDSTQSVTSNLQTNGNDGQIGNQQFASGRFYSGSISNVAIFDTALPATGTNSVATLYNNGVPLTSAIATSNLKAWYKLDNTATFSTNWSIPDASGNGNTGTSSGMTEQNLVNNNVSTLNGTSSGMTTANLVNSDLTRSIPYSSYSMDFDAASSDYIDCGDITNLDGSAALTLSAWVKPTASGTSSADGIIAKDGATRGFYLATFTDNKFRFLISTNGSTNDSFNSNLAYTTNEFYHLAATWDGSNLKLYINGSLDTTQAVSNATGTFSNNSNTLRIGNNGGNGYFNGKISNASIFNTALSQDQILTIYNGGVPNDISSLSPVGWWSLSGDSYYNGTDFICPDLSSNSNNGTSSGMGGTELVGNGPGSTANGTATSMNIPENLQGNAPNSTKNAFSINMTETDRETNVPS